MKKFRLMLCLGLLASLATAAKADDLGSVVTPPSVSNALYRIAKALEGQPPAYSVVTNTATVKCVYGTNVVPVPNGGTLTADTTGWKEGQTVFTKIVPAGTYAVATTITLTGYGTWPTAPFDCVAWKSGEKVYITVLREEE